MPYKLLPLLSYIISLHDPYGNEHGARVADLSLRLAKRVGITGADELRELELAAHLHDIGKIGIPEFIRRLTTRYLPAERWMMEHHSVIGEHILDQVPEATISKKIKSIIRSHHENWSGTGYPDKLQVEEIPLGARIIRICDFYDAVISIRGYQKAKTREEALRFMTDEQTMNAWADPTLFSSFIAMMSQR